MMVAFFLYLCNAFNNKYPNCCGYFRVDATALALAQQRHPARYMLDVRLCVPVCLLCLLNDLVIMIIKFNVVP